MAHKANLKRKALAEATSVQVKASNDLNLSSEDDMPESKPKKAKFDIGRQLMSKMGYTDGKGLGKHEQGLTAVIATSNQKGRRGLGYSISDINVDEQYQWTEEKEREFVSARESFEWLESAPEVQPPGAEELANWIKNGPRKLTIHDETDFCDPSIVTSVMDCKDVFDKLSGHELRRARSMSNPFESVEKGIFQNRAAMKMANIDSLLDFMFTSPFDAKKRPLLNKNDLLYFADICAGPGGFSEYVLWKKGWEAKGFGFTLKGPNDFKLEEFYAGSAETFEPHYGSDPIGGDGNIYSPENLVAFRNHVLENTDNRGVHFVMADGGFSVEGQENIQEILSKRLYLCQFLCALGILRTGGHLVCKLFDIFTPFSVGLIYIMYRCFDKVCLLKPNTSRPANSERYIICKGKREGTVEVENHLFKVNCHLDSVAAQNNENENDVISVVPKSVIKNDKAFFNYVYDSNTTLGRRQILFLSKVKAFAENEGLFESRQIELKRESFRLWDVPLKGRVVPTRPNAVDKFRELMIRDGPTDISGYAHKPTILTKDLLMSAKKPLEFLRNFKCMVLSGEDVATNSMRTDRGFFLGLGRHNNYYWDGCSTSSWKKLEIKIAFPQDTLVYAEQVQELRGEGRGQRRGGAFHIIDALFLGGKDVRKLDLEDRLVYAAKLVKAIHKPTISDLVIPRVKHIYSLLDLSELFSGKMDVRECKGGNQKFRLCYDIDHEKFIDPCGLLILKTVTDKYICVKSKSSGKTYYFEKSSKKSVFDKPSAASASFNETYASRLFWRWDNENNLKEEPNEALKAGDTVDRYSLERFIKEKEQS